MNKNAIKKFATEARRELISRVGQRALKYGISDKEVGNPNDDSVGGHLLSSTEKKQRAALIEQIKEKGYEQVMEEVAYTWFNRFSALRFMEVNGYLPTRVRVFTDENNAFKPQILIEAIHMELDGLDMEKVYAYKEANDNDELYKYLLITQCNALNSVLPGMFQKIADYTELLFPDNLLREGSVVQQMIELIPEEDWKDAVQIIGWLYQYYNSEKKDDVFAALKKNVKITKENIPAATQLFTPDWIVRYMVENSLGRLWVEGHPNDELKSQWKYYLEEAEQEPDVQAQLASIREEYKALKPEDILCIDPCSGSGHILAYMFDVLVQIYEAYGVDTRTAVASIVENNIYGLDIDDRAAQLAYFSVMMKACQYDKRFLRRKVQPHVYSIVESNHVDPNVVDYFCNGDAKLKAAMDTIIEELHDAREYGSIITVSQQDWEALYARFDEIQNESVMSIYSISVFELKKLIQVAEVLNKKYHSVVTNPPYMEISSGSAKLVNYVNKNFIGGKTDMFAVFIEKASDYALNSGFVGMITQPSLTSLVSFEKLRKKLFVEKSFYSLIHMGRGIFGIDFGSVSFVYRNMHIHEYEARYFKLYDRTFQYIQPEDIRDIFLNAKDNSNYRFDFETYDTSNGVTSDSALSGNKIAFTANQDNFMLVPGVPFAYTMSANMIKAYSNGLLGDLFTTREGMATAGNDVFLRMWYEIDFDRISFSCHDSDEAANSHKKWFPYNKGGDYRKWYGNNDYVVDWEDDGYRIRNNRDEKTGRIRSHNYNGDYAFKKGLTWSSISAGDISIRWSTPGYLFDSKGAKGFADSEDEMYAILGFLNSTTAMRYLKVISPTMDFKVGDIVQLPFYKQILKDDALIALVKRNIELLKEDWDLRETSWDFKYHPVIDADSLEAGVSAFIENRLLARKELKANEEKINRLIAVAYGLEDTKCDVTDDKLSIAEYDAAGVVKAFISYAVGCMFGRYSLKTEGLVCAGSKYDATLYGDFSADEDNIIPISDDEYFEDDIVGRFVSFIETVYCKENLQENLQFIASVLGGKGQPRDVIRSYFMNDFYSDHCNMCSITGSGKRPYYWLFDSGKKKGFRCLIYMHRYQPDTIARIRTDYVHEQQARYRTAIADLETRIANASTSERVKLNKQLKTLNDQATEIHAYEEKIHHLADQMISIDLDDGVKKNYEIFKDVLAKIK